MFSVKKTTPPEPLRPVFEILDAVVLGKTEQVRLSLACLLAQGHLLVEDVPGVGKTTLVRTLARVLGLDTTRVQFTNDLLPADILGTSIFEANEKNFLFHRGPIFTHVLIADELNRGTPRTQSAFLQAMEERRVSLDGLTYDLPRPFFVAATQNPREQVGTYPLPESQLDRFLMRIHMGYPSPEFEIELLKGYRDRDRDVKALLNPEQVLEIQRAVEAVHGSETVLKFIQRILAESRGLGHGTLGLSPRSGMSLLAAARAWAYLSGREFVIPEDVQTIAPWVVNHRLHYSSLDKAFEHSRDLILGIRVE